MPTQYFKNFADVTQASFVGNWNRKCRTPPSPTYSSTTIKMCLAYYTTLILSFGRCVWSVFIPSSFVRALQSEMEHFSCYREQVPSMNLNFEANICPGKHENVTEPFRRPKVTTSTQTDRYLDIFRSACQRFTTSSPMLSGLSERPNLNVYYKRFGISCSLPGTVEDYRGRRLRFSESSSS